MSSRVLPPTRGEALTMPPSDGVRIGPAHSGIDITDEQLGLRVVPQADGRLGFQVIGLPARTGFQEACSLLQSDARHDFAPSAVRLDGDRLVCLEPNASEPLLHEGFVLTLAPAMAAVLADWLPRLVRVAERAQQVAQRVEAHLTPAPSAHGLDVCTDLVAEILLDGQSAADARRLVGQHHWTLAKPEWCAAIDAPDVRQLLDAVAHEGRTPPAEPVSLAPSATVP